MATTVHTITISVADLEDGTYAIALSDPETVQTNQFTQWNYKPADVIPGPALAGYLADMTLSALGIDEEA